MALDKIQQKKGVALITVLLFMMMATIAATAVHKWLVSENKASAARLKQSEAYQASQAGINAARAWLAFNGNETGALVTQFLKTKKPIKLDSAGQQPMVQRTNFDMQQDFSVWLTDVDVSESPIKVKIISKGTGRDGSSFSQVAILKVEGLYQIPLPGEVASTTYEYAYFGGSINYAGDHHATSMVINGNWSGNPGTVSKDFIVTGNTDLSGSNINVGDNACIGGSLNTASASRLSFGSIYVGGSASLMASDGPVTITNSAYFDGNVNVMGDINVSQNITINNGFKLDMGAHDATIQGNMCFGDNGYVNFMSESNGHRFSALGNVWMPSSGSLTGSMSPPGLSEFKTFGAKSTSEIYMVGTYQDSVANCITEPGKTCYYYHQEGNFFSELYGMITGTYNWRYFTTQSENRSSVTFGTAPFACGDEVKDYCDTKWEKKTGCNGAQYMVKDMLQTAYEHFESKANKVTCAANITNFNGNDETTVKALNVCYESAVAAEDPYLYNGYLVVRFSPNVNATPLGTLKGKFIIIYEENAGTLKLPPSDGVTMVYLKNGAGDISQTVGGEKYNYFFYTKKDIAQLLQGNSPWRGSVYAEATSCAKVGNVQGGVDLEYNAEVLNDLIQAKAVCDAEASECGDDSNEGPGVNSSNSTNDEGSQKNDSHWIALSPTLKISLASQYANEESIRQDADILTPSLLVMPRIIYLTVDEKLVEGNEKNYNVIYLGGLEPSGSGSAACDYGTRYSSGSISEISAFEKLGLHSCRYTEGNYSSDFWVWVSDKETSSKVGFDILQYNLGDKCIEDGVTKKDVKLVLTSGTKIMPGTLNIYVYNSSAGTTVTAKNSSSGMFELSDPSSLNGYDVYKLTIAQENLTSLEDPLFEVEINGGCAAATGFVQFQLEDANFNDGLTIGMPNNELILFGEGAAKVYHKPIEEDPNASTDITERPDCPEQDESTPWSWGTFDADNLGKGCQKFEEGYNDYSGPWLCPLGADVKAIPNDKSIWEKECDLWQVSNVRVLGTEDTYVYASLKKKQFILHVEIEGLQGTTDTYDSENWEAIIAANAAAGQEITDDAEIEITAQDGTSMGRCKSGNKGICDFKVYYGETYYVNAKGKYFDHWSFSCASNPEGKKDSEGIDKCGTHTNSHGSRTIAITTKEDVTVQANYTKAGYCFNEDFKHLHPYCDHELTPKTIGGFTWFRLNNKANTKFYRSTDPTERAKQDAQIDDFAHGDGEYCIDQCVTNWKYRYSEIAKEGKEMLGRDVGSEYKYYYDYYCSVEGKTYEDDNAPIATKEDAYWSYYDPGISCTAMIDRAFDVWKLPWTKGKNRADYKNNCNNSDVSFSYRWNGGKVNDNDHPPSLKAPRVYGGYYSKEDEYSPWLKVINVYQSRQSKFGVRKTKSGTTVETSDITLADLGINQKRTVNGAVWNVKPFIDRDEGFVSGHGREDFLTSFVILRKEEAGYNGTYTKTFTWTGKGEANLTGNFSAMVFRSNADASSYFILGVNPSGTIEGASASVQKHFILCHATERNTYYASSTLKDDAITNEIFGPLNANHCVAEDISANIPWQNIADRTMQLTVELENEYATITFSYSNTKTGDVDTDLEGANSTIYIKKTFNLEDPGLFGYPIDIPEDQFYELNGVKILPEVDAEGNSTHIYRNPIEHMKNNRDEYGYVGFVVHSAAEKIYNLNWRSGGSCGGAHRDQPGVYCGFENSDVEAGSHSIPIRYMYDFCPDGGECKCEYEYNIDNELTWHKESSFMIPKTPRKYPYGSLKVRASCYEQSNISNKKTIVESCRGFTSFDPDGDNKCYDDYVIFEKYNKAETFNLFEMYNSRIASLDNYYRMKIDSKYAGNNGKTLRNTYCLGHKTNEFCSIMDSVSEENGSKKYTGLDTTILMRIASSSSETSSHNGTISNYLQLTDAIDNTNGKSYLNLKGSDLTFRIYQNTVIDSIRIYLEDAAGNSSEHFSIDSLVEGENDAYNNKGGFKITNEKDVYCDIYDDRIKKADYNNLSTDERSKYNTELCKVNLVWVRDLKRHARVASEEPGHTWAELFPYRKVRASVSKLKGATNFDPTRVSRIYFVLYKESNGGGIHISHLQSDCPTSLDVTECRESSDGINFSTEKSIIESEPLYIKANVPGASQCRLELRQFESDLTYADIKGPDFTAENGLATPWFSCNDIMEKGPVTLTCENSTSDCVAALTVVAKNSSNETTSCRNDAGSATPLKITVRNAKYKCYGFDYGQDYRTDYISSLFTADNYRYMGSGLVSMGLEFEEGSYVEPTNVSLISPEGNTIQTFEVKSDGTPTEKYQRCAQNAAKEVNVTLTSNGTVESGTTKGNCAYFQFNPVSYGSGDYTLVMGNAKVPACKINIDAPAANLVEGSCVIQPSTAGIGAKIQISATGTNLAGKGTVKIGSSEHECDFDEANSTVHCSEINAPSQKGTYNVELTYNGKKITCPSLTVADKPTVQSCDVLDGKFVAKIENPANVQYNYRLIRCADLLGMGCKVEREGREVETGSSSAISILLPRAMSSIQDGKGYTYVFQVSTSSAFPEDNVSYCPSISGNPEDQYREERGDRDMTLECGFTTATAPKEGNVTFYVKNAHGFKSEKTMNLVTSGGTDLGTVKVKSDGSTTEQTLTLPASLTVGEKYEIEVHDNGKSVCKAEVSIAPVTAQCSFNSGASDVKKGGEYYGFEIYNVKGLASSQYMTLKYGESVLNARCYVDANSKNTSTCNVKIPVTAKSGTQKFTLVYDGNTVCEASTNVLPIKTDCQIIKANGSNEAVNKAIATKNVEIKMLMSNFQNVGGRVDANIRREGGDNEPISFDQYTSYPTSNQTAFGVPDLTGSVTYNVYDESGEGICTTPPTVNVVKPSVECKVANDDSRGPENRTTIMNSNHTPNTHFYFYVKYTGNPTTSFVVTSPWNEYATEYDVQGDDHSYYSKDCGSHNASGYNCVTVYPSYNEKGGFTAQTSPYRYIYYVDYSDYYNGTYSGTKLKCQMDVYIR